jgi:anaerobic selenocysteine-containing dehydrogenase
LPGFEAGEAAFRLMTLRSEGQFNTVVYEAEDLYRGNTRRDVVMMAAADAESLGLKEGDRVTVQSDAGKMAALVSIVDIAPGSLAMYYPEANALVPRILDPSSRTPAFKSVAARIIPVNA